MSEFLRKPETFDAVIFRNWLLFLYIYVTIGQRVMYFLKSSVLSDEFSDLLATIDLSKSSARERAHRRGLKISRST